MKLGKRYIAVKNGGGIQSSRRGAESMYDTYSTARRYALHDGKVLEVDLDKLFVLTEKP